MRARVNLSSKPDPFKESLAKTAGMAEKRVHIEKQDKFAVRLQGIMHSLLWVTASILLNSYLKTWAVIQQDPLVWWFPFGILAILCILATISIAFYLTYILPKVDPEAAKDYIKTRPRLSISAGAASLIAYFSMIVQFWPVWGFWAFVNITVTCFAVLMSGNLFPPYS
jgi:hypothetical protein